MSRDNQKPNLNLNGEPKVHVKVSLLKRSFENKNIPPQPPVKYTKVKLITLPNQQPAPFQIEKRIPPQPIVVEYPKVYVPPAAEIDNDTEEIDVVAIEPERRMANLVKVLPVKPGIQYELKIPTLQSQIPGTFSASPASLALTSKSQAYTYFNFDELRRRTRTACARRSLSGPCDKSLQLLSIAAYDYLKDIIEQITAVARSRVEGASNKEQQALVKEERKKIEFLNKVQGHLHARESDENPNNSYLKGVEKKRLHRELQIFNTNETALAAIGGRRCPAPPKVNVTNEKSKNVTQVQMQDCIFFMENNSMFCKSPLLYTKCLQIRH